MAKGCLLGSNYDDGCRCTGCVTVHSGYNRKSQRRAAERRWGNTFPTDRLDPTYSMKVVWDAHAVRGLDFVHIGRITGLNKKTIRNLYIGKSKYVLRYVEDAIREHLDTDWIKLNREPTTLVDREPYRDIVYRLMAQGWTIFQMIDIIKEHSEYNTGFMHNIARKQYAYEIEWQNAQAILWLSRFIGDRHGPSQRTRIRMQNRGIFPQIHYDETGELIVESLTPEQRAILKRLR